MKDICLWSHTALNRNKHVYEFLPLPLLSHDLIPHSTQISQHNQETFEETEWYVQSASNYTAHGSNHNRWYLKKINLENEP